MNKQRLSFTSQPVVIREYTVVVWDIPDQLVSLGNYIVRISSSDAGDIHLEMLEEMPGLL